MGGREIDRDRELEREKERDRETEREIVRKREKGISGVYWVDLLGFQRNSGFHADLKF